MPKATKENSAKRFWLISIGAHVIVVFVILFTPARTIIFPPEEPPKQPEITMRDERLERVIEDIRASEAEMLMRRVALLQAGEERMQGNFESFNTRFEGFQESQRESARDDFRKLPDKIVPLQQELKHILAAAKKTGQVDPAIEEAEALFADLQDLQEQMRLSMVLLDLPEDSVSQQRTAEEAQFAVQSTWRGFRVANQNYLRSLRRAEDFKEQVKSHEENLLKARVSLESEETKIEKAQTTRKEIRAKIDQLQNVENFDSSKIDSLKSEDQETRDQIREAKRQGRKLQREIERQDRRISSDQSNVEEQEKAAERHLLERGQNLDKMIEQQEAATRAQESANQTAETAFEIKENESAAVKLKGFPTEGVATNPGGQIHSASVLELPLQGLLWLAQTISNSGRDPAEVESDTSGRRSTLDETRVPTLTTLYDNAVASTEGVTEYYRRIRAIQLSRARDIPYQEAYRNIDSVMPSLRPIDREILESKLSNPQRIAQHKEEVEKVKQEVEMMIELVKRLLLEIEVIESELMEQLQFQDDKTLEEILMEESFDPDKEINAEELGETREQRSQMIRTLEELAKEDAQNQAKDLAEAMKQIALQRDPESRIELTGASVAPPPALREISEINEQLIQDDPLEVENFQLGRSVTTDGNPRKWLVVDSWHTIGPFPNPSRINLNRKFPPETVVDLDAAYSGKDGREIAWEWMQARQPLIEPASSEPYGIWYAYTEIYMDEACDLWVAVGSDDKSNIWLNDLPIWISSDRLKGWKIDEGLRRVHFRKGVNRILYRIENGWREMGFSFVILTSDGR